MKVLVEIRRETWSRVRQYATERRHKLGESVDELLQNSLSLTRVKLKGVEDKPV
jgi:hypothetical protein